MTTDLERRFEDAVDANQTELAMEILRSWPEGSRDGLYWWRVAVGEKSQNNLPGTAAAFEKSVALGYPAHAELASVYDDLGIREEEVDELFEAGLDFDPSDIAALINYGVFSNRHGRTELAETLFERAALLDATVYWQLGSLRAETGRPELALGDLNRAIAAGEQRARLDRAMLMVDSLSADEVLEEFRSSGLTTARAESILFLTDRGQLEAAEAEGRAGVAENDPLSYGPLAVVLSRLGQSSEAARFNQLAIDSGDGDYLESEEPDAK